MADHLAYGKIGYDNDDNRNYQATSSKPVLISSASRLKKLLFKWLRLSTEPRVKIYHGYGYAKQILVFGHVFGVSPASRVKYRQNIWTNSLALFRSFMVKPLPGATVRLCWNNEWLYANTEPDGFFKFEFEPSTLMETGWYTVAVELLDNAMENRVIAKNTGLIYIPPLNRFGCISDIDDTFLISHSSNIFKRLYVLLTRNAHTRKPFEGVVKHYQLLAQAGSGPDKSNPFFYVSSSEWNLYDFIVEFARKNELPPGIYLLNQLKRLREVLKTGQNKHVTKFARIVRIMEAFPEMRFILLGDSSQQDPDIYASIAEHFPRQVHAVYIRDVYRRNRKRVTETLIKMERAGVPCCFFRHSRDAILHSQKIGLISKDFIYANG